MRRILVLLASALCAAAGAADQPDAAAAYSHVLPLQISGKQAIVQLRLPRDVYLHARTPDLADLRVFDAAGSPQPAALVRGTPLQEQQTLALPAAVFPVYAPARQGRQIDDVQVHTSSDGAVVSVSTHPNGARAAGDVLAGLVLDLGQAPAGASVSGLTFALPDGARSYNAEVVVDASDDLQHWEPLAEASLSWLVNGRGESVESSRITFPARSFRYARIRWQDGDPVEFRQVTAQAVRSQDAPRQWEAIVLQAQRAPSGPDLVYTAPIAVPAESAGLVLHGQNVVLPAAIGQYAAAPSGGTAFHPLASATFYQLTQDGRQRVSGDVALPETHLAQWVVRAKGDVATLSEPPALRLNWQPATLVFVAGGKPPYTLAFGLPGASPRYLPLGQVAPGFDARELARAESATTGPLIEQHAAGLAGEDAAQAAARHRVWWLWGLLVCGVGVLGWMAWRLVTQMKGDDAQSPGA